MADVEVDVNVAIGHVELRAGRIWSHRRRGTESATFAYATDYLAHPAAYPLDPALPLVAGQQQTPAGRPMFGAFSDCAPDRWGRRLIKRAERRRVDREGGAERSFGEIGYLLGVRDDLRQGALRFRDPMTGMYLAQEGSGVPHLIDLPRLLNAADRLERDEASDDDVRALLRGGSSLGGARPKAHVLDGKGRIAIAKFPSPTTDEWDVIRWEAVALNLARDAGIRVPASALHLVDGKPVLVVDRFDRTQSQRVGYASAMTMLEATDGDDASYLDIAETIEEHAPSARADLHELWRRIAFSVLVTNLDDHLRNHGFLRTSTAGWELSPAFDINPDPSPGARQLKTAIDGRTYEPRIDVLMDVAGVFRLSPEQAASILRGVLASVERWRSAAASVGLSAAAIEEMAPAFEHGQLLDARAV